MIVAGISRDFSFMPRQLPDSSTGAIIDYKQRTVPYYANLARLAADELELNVKQGKPLEFTYYMAMPFSAMIMHAIEVMKPHRNDMILNMHPQSSLVKISMDRSFGVRCSGRKYISALVALEDSFAEADELDDASKLRLASFADNFAQQIEFFAKGANVNGNGLEDKHANRRLPFVRIGWIGEYKDKAQAQQPSPAPQNSYTRSFSPAPVSSNGRHEITVPRDADVMLAAG